MVKINSFVLEVKVEATCRKINMEKTKQSYQCQGSAFVIEFFVQAVVLNKYLKY